MARTIAIQRAMALLALAFALPGCGTRSYALPGANPADSIGQVDVQVQGVAAGQAVGYVHFALSTDGLVRREATLVYRPRVVSFVQLPAGVHDLTIEALDARHVVLNGFAHHLTVLPGRSTVLPMRFQLAPAGGWLLKWLVPMEGPGAWLPPAESDGPVAPLPAHISHDDGSLDTPQVDVTPVEDGAVPGDSAIP